MKLDAQALFRLFGPSAHLVVGSFYGIFAGEGACHGAPSACTPYVSVSLASRCGAVIHGEKRVMPARDRCRNRNRPLPLR